MFVLRGRTNSENRTVQHRQEIHDSQRLQEQAETLLPRRTDSMQETFSEATPKFYDFRRTRLPALPPFRRRLRHRALHSPSIIDAQRSHQRRSKRDRQRHLLHVRVSTMLVCTANHVSRMMISYFAHAHIYALSPFPTSLFFFLSPPFRAHAPPSRRPYPATSTKAPIGLLLPLQKQPRTPSTPSNSGSHCDA